MEKKDFFISYAGENEDWALWVAETLSRHGYTVCLQAWDIVPGDNFINSMDDFLEKSDNFIAIWSRDYTHSTYCKTEWTSAFHEYKAGTMKKFLPLRVERCTLPSVLGGIVHDNLYECDELLAEKKLLRAVGYTGIIRKKGSFPNNLTPDEAAPLPDKQETKTRRHESQIKEPVFEDDEFDQKKKFIAMVVVASLVALTLTAGGVSYLAQHARNLHSAPSSETYISSDNSIQQDNDESAKNDESNKNETRSLIEVQQLRPIPESVSKVGNVEVADQATEGDGGSDQVAEDDKGNAALTERFMDMEDDNTDTDTMSGLQSIADTLRELFQKGKITSQELSIKLTELAQNAVEEGLDTITLSLLEDAIDNDPSNADAYNKLGDYYYDKKAWEDALSFFLKAAELGDAVGYSNIGVCYYYNDHEPIDRNYATARENFEKAAQLGDIRSLWYLGEIYYNGDKYVPRDYELAYYYYELGAKAGYPAAIRDLGVLYEYGYGTTQDYEIARQYYEKAAELKDDRAISNLANLYMNGTGVARDYTKARQYYEQAADLGNARAYFNLGNIYEKGLGVEADMDKAVDFYKIARSMDNKSARDRLDALNIP